MNIPKKIAEKYHIADKEFYENDLLYYETFLIQTDHIPNKIIEAQMLGKEIDDYTEILEYRQVARDEINRLEAEQEVNNEFEQ